MCSSDLEKLLFSELSGISGRFGKIRAVAVGSQGPTQALRPWRTIFFARTRRVAPHATPATPTWHPRKSMKSQSRTIQAAGIDFTVAQPKCSRQTFGPVRIGRRTILPRIALHRRNARNMSRQTGRMQKRSPRTRQVLHTQKHAELLDRKSTRLNSSH